MDNTKSDASSNKPPFPRPKGTLGVTHYVNKIQHGEANPPTHVNNLNTQTNYTAENYTTTTNQSTEPEEDSLSESNSEESSPWNSNIPLDENISLTDFPNEILCLLISHVESKSDIRSLMFTSKIFVELVYYSWSRLSLRNDNKIDYHQFLNLPADRLKYLVELDISNCTKMTNALFKQIIDKTPNLQVLKMKNCKRLTRIALQHLSGLFNRVHSIDLRGCNNEELGTVRVGQKTPIREFAIDAIMFEKFRPMLDPQIVTSLNFFSRIPSRLKLETLKTFVNLVTFKGSIFESTADCSSFPNLENLILDNEVEKLIFAAPQKIKRLAFRLLNSKFDTSVFADLSNLESLWMHGKYVAHLSIKFFPKLRELSTGLMLNIADLVEHKIFTKLEARFTAREHVLQVLNANPYLVDFRFNMPLTVENFNAFQKLRNLEVLHMRGTDANAKKVNWSKLKNLKELSFDIGGYNDVIEQLKRIPKLHKLVIHAPNQLFNGMLSNDVLNWAKNFEGFPKLKIIILRDNTMLYLTEKVQGLMNVKGITYVEIRPN